MALTGKQEMFAQCVAVKKMSLTDAYSFAYDAAKMAPGTVQNEASKLAAHPGVAARLQVLSARAEAAAVKTAAHTLDKAMGEAESLLQDAQALGQISAGVAAATLRAKLSGLLTEKPNEKKDVLDDMDVAGLVATRDEAIAKLKRLKEALDLVGDLDPAPAAPLMRRVIG